MKFNEIINFFLWKQLPYDIKCLLFSAVSGYYIRRNKTDYSDVIKNISEINDQKSHIYWKVDKINNDLKYQCVRKKIEYMNKLYFKDDYLSYTYFIKRILENLENLESDNMKRDRRFLQEPFRIHFNSTEIRDKYGDFVYLYYLDDNKSWVRFTQSLPYRWIYRIPYHEAKQRYQNILISHVNFIDDTIHPTLIQEAIKNPIFKFSIGELQNNYFKFNEDNPINKRYFIKENILLNLLKNFMVHSR